VPVIGRSSVVRIDAGGKRGTGFLIRGGKLVTALHAVARIEGERVEWYDPVELRYVVDGAPLDTERLTGYEPVAFDVAEDWVVLGVKEASDVPEWEAMEIGPESMDTIWRTYGFPDEAGSAASGKVTTIDAPRPAIMNHERTLIPAMQLYADQAAAGRGQPVPGYSGAPVVMDGRVVGILRNAPYDCEGIATGGTLFACPIKQIMTRLGRECAAKATHMHLANQLKLAIHSADRTDALALLLEILEVPFTGPLTAHDAACSAIVGHVVQQPRHYRPLLDALDELRASAATKHLDMRRIADILLPFCWVQNSAAASIPALLRDDARRAAAINGAVVGFTPRMYFSAGMQQVLRWPFAEVVVEGLDDSALDDKVTRAITTALKKPKVSVKRLNELTKQHLQKGRKPVLIGLDHPPGESAMRALRQRFPCVFFFVMTHGYEPPDQKEHIDGVQFLRPLLDLNDEADLADEYKALQEAI
jgi:hypothetical protein